MTEIRVVERRLSGVDDRRRVTRGGRRQEDRRPAGLSVIIPCTACGVAWASLASFEHQRKQSVATYWCPRCGHTHRRVVVV